MAGGFATRLKAFFEETTDGGLRSIVRYEQTSFDVLFLRDDVRALYSEEEFAQAIDESRFESLATPVYADAFADGHGSLECFVTCFENVVEMNFAVSDGAGVAVALDAEALTQSRGLVADARALAADAVEAGP